ncbi:hypothetical protein CNR22_07225 [Sphingobacteriaceae bacterium]|nr:hypothetical protein CNR22_07225 [Sphingobacteriaceae bacterium]
MKGIAIGVIFIFLVSSCRKYPQGGLRINARLLLNTEMSKSSFMDLKKYEVNNIDSTDFVSGNGDRELLKSYLRFFKYERDNYYQLKTLGAAELMVSDDEYLQAYNLKTVVPLQLNNGVKLKNVFNPVDGGITWRIIRCRSKELILSADAGGFHYRLTFKEH